MMVRMIKVENRSCIVMKCIIGGFPVPALFVNCASHILNLLMPDIVPASISEV